MIWVMTIVLVSLVAFLFFRRSLSRRQAIGRSVRLEYLDQNVTLEKQLPVSGQVTKMLELGSNHLFLLKLDRNIYYDDNTYDHVLVKERTLTASIGSLPADVHILLPKIKEFDGPIAWNDLDHVAWGTLKAI